MWDWRESLQAETEQLGCLAVAVLPVSVLNGGCPRDGSTPHTGKALLVSPYTSLGLNGSGTYLPVLFSCDVGLRVLDLHLVSSALSG